MRKNINSFSDALIKRDGRDKFISRSVFILLGVLAVAVVFVLFAQSALTMEVPANKSAVCGIEEHTHGSECYARGLICGLDENEPEEPAEELMPDETPASSEESMPSEEPATVDGTTGGGEEEFTAGDEPAAESGESEAADDPDTTAETEPPASFYTEPEEEPGHTHHIHTEECYGDILICGYDYEHTHTDECYPVVTDNIKNEIVNISDIVDVPVFDFSDRISIMALAAPATNIDASYVRMFTTQGKPIWVKLSLPSGGSGVTLTPGSSVTFRLDYVFDIEAAFKPVAGDTLQLYTSGFPSGIFTLPSNMHTSGNFYRNNIITLTFADVGGYKLADGADGWMTVTFFVSGNETPGTFTPNIIGDGSAENALKIEKIEIPEPGTDPGPSDPGDGGYTLIGKLAEHVLYDDGNGGWIPSFYSYYLPMMPSYISYEIVLNDGGGVLWAQNHIGDFDYLTFTDTLSPGQEFVVAGEPDNRNYQGFAPIYSIALWKKDPITGNVTGPVNNVSIDKLDAENIQLTVSPDRRTFTLTIKKGAKILGTDETVDEFTTIRLDYYAKVTDPKELKFSNKAKIEYVKGGEVTGGESGVTLTVIEQAGATFIWKEVGRATAGGGFKDMGLHGYDDPLIVNKGDELVYIINYIVTGDEGEKPAGYEFYDILPDNLEFVENMFWHNSGFLHDSIYSDPGNPQKIIFKCPWGLLKGGTYKAVFKVRIKDITPGETVLNTMGNTTVVKEDGYAIQVFKCDADDKQPLQGAQFKLYEYKDNSWDVYKNKSGTEVILTTEVDGYSSIENLPVGKYKLIETTAPNDYPLDPENPITIEFEILPDSTGMKGINKIYITEAPDNMPNPVDDEGIAVFTIPNGKEEPTGSISIVKNITAADKIPGRQFFVQLHDKNGSLMRFDEGGNYVGSEGITNIEINDKTPVLLKNIPLSLSPITVTETNASKKGYIVSYMVNGKPGTNVVNLTQNNRLAFVTVTNTKDNAPTADITIDGKKIIAGNPPDGNIEFAFSIEEVTDATGTTAVVPDSLIYPMGKTATTNGAGDFGFTIEGLKNGTYYFRIRETIPDMVPTGWTYDPIEYIVTVNAADGKAYIVDISIRDGTNESDEIIFTNTYTEVDIEIPGQKFIAGVASTDEKFTFLLERCDESGNVYEDTDDKYYRDEITITGADSFSFKVEGLTAGTYWFRITEVRGDAEGWTYDNTEYIVRVDVGGDPLTAIVTNVTGSVSFYSHPATGIDYSEGTVRVVNVAYNKVMPMYLTDKNNSYQILIGAAYCIHIGTTTWEGNEYDPSYVEYIAETQWVVSNGFWSQDRPYAADPVAWGNNTNIEWLRSRFGIPELTQWEAYIATQLAIWHFTNYEDGQTPNAGDANINSLYLQLIAGANGSISDYEPSINIGFDTSDADLVDGWYGPITLTAAKNPVNFTSQNIPVKLAGQNGHTVSTTSSGGSAELTLTDGDKFYINIGPGDISDMTELVKASASITLIVGGSVYDAQIFAIRGDGQESFDGQKFTIQPLIGIGAVNEATVEATATLNGGKDSNIITFTNCRTNPVNFVPQVLKITEGKDIKDMAGQFEFEFYSTGWNGGAGSNPVTATNDSDGIVTFPTITYTQPGIYYYTIKEIPGDAASWTYDRTEYVLRVIVTKNGDGQLEIEAEYIYRSWTDGEWSGWSIWDKYSNNPPNIKFINTCTAGPRLPETGGMGTLPIAITGTAIMIFSAAGGFIYRKKLIINL